MITKLRRLIRDRAYLAGGFVLAALATTSLAAGQPTSGRAGVPQVAASYLLGPEDVLEVTIWPYNDLSRLVAVRPDGKISLPLVGEVRVARLTVEQLTEGLIRAYSAYINNPHVTVILKEFRKIRVSVLSQAAKPGTYALPPGSSLLDLLSAAGGVTDVAALKEAKLLRPGKDPVTVDLERVLAGDNSLNVLLQGGETLVIPEDVGSIVNVAGEVAKPGRYRLKGDMRVLDVLLMAGGLTDRAAAAEARITRASGEQPAFDLKQLMLHQDMNQNVTLRPGDTLFVPEDLTSKFYVVGDVNRPGVYPLKGKVTLLEAIAIAGGLTPHPFGTAKTAQIVRRTQDTPEITASNQARSIQRLGERGIVMSLDLRAAMRGDLSKDEPLRPGDVVVVPESALNGLPAILGVITTILFGFRP